MIINYTVVYNFNFFLFKTKLSLMNLRCDYGHSSSIPHIYKTTVTVKESKYEEYDLTIL